MKRIAAIIQSLKTRRSELRVRDQNTSLPDLRMEPLYRFLFQKLTAPIQCIEISVKVTANSENNYFLLQEFGQIETPITRSKIHEWKENHAEYR